MGEVDGGRGFEHFGDEMVSRANADAADLQFARLRFGERDDLGQRLGTEGRARDQRIDAVAGLPDRDEVAAQIDTRGRAHGRHGGVRACGLQQRVAVGFGLQDAREPDLAGGTAHVLDDERLAEALFHPALRRPHHDVRGPAGRKRNDDPDRPRWKGFRAQGERPRRGARKKRDERAPSHVAFPLKLLVGA